MTLIFTTVDTGATTNVSWTIKQSELSKLTKCMGSRYQTIAIEFLGYSIEEIEELQESHRGSISRVKLDILKGWLHRHPQGNPREVGMIVIKVDRYII